MSSKIARYYDKDQNPRNAFLPGVPRRDIAEAEWERLPDHLQRSVDVLPFYRKTKPRTDTPMLTARPTSEE